ncbi:MAG: acetate--CoA ligase family protein [Acidiferrobacterales bacterium]
MKSIRENIGRLLAPQQVAFIGGREAAEAIRQCRDLGYRGELWPVHPTRKELGGYPCFPSIDALPRAPDAAFVAVRRETTIEVVHELAAKGAGACVCYAAGFAEIGKEGQRLQKELVRAAGDMALVGPNCYGVLNYLDGLALWPSAHGGRRVERGIALVSQSGNIALNLTMTGRCVPIAYVVSVGNEAVLGLGDYIPLLVDDPRVTAIGLYIEGLSDIESFSRAAEYALQKGKPVVALKVGSSEIASRLTLSHTSSLAGADALYVALFDRLGIVRVHSLTTFMETLKLLSLTGPLAGRRLAVLTCSGGEAALLADLAKEVGLTIPELTRHQVEALRTELPAFATISNPLDYNTSLWGDTEALRRCFATLMQGDVDVTLLVIDYPRFDVHGIEEWDAAIQAIITAQQQSRKKTAVVSTFPELLPEGVGERLAANGVVPLQGLGEAIAALAAAAWCYERREKLVSLAAEGALQLPAVASAVDETRLLNEWEAKQALAPFGLTVPPGHLTSGADAPAAAKKIGFPVVLKAVSNDLMHKTEVDGIALNLLDARMVAAAAKRMELNQAHAYDTFLIESMVTDVVAELIVGVKRDDQLGLALVIGTGGTLVNLIEDCRSLLLPTDRQSIAEALDSLKVAQLLAGYRGRPVGDREAAIDAMLAVATFAERHRDRLIELDVNPLLVLPQGYGAVAADASIRMITD